MLLRQMQLRKDAGPGLTVLVPATASTSVMRCLHVQSGVPWLSTCSTACAQCFISADVLAEEQAHEAIFQPLPFHYIEVAHLLLRHAKEAFEEGNDVLYQVSSQRLAACMKGKPRVALSKLCLSVCSSKMLILQYTLCHALDLPCAYVKQERKSLAHAYLQAMIGRSMLSDAFAAAQTANLLKDIRIERFQKIDMGLKALEGPITVKLNNVSAMECNMIRHFFQGALNHFYKLAQVGNSPSSFGSAAVLSHSMSDIVLILHLHVCTTCNHVFSWLHAYIQPAVHL